MSTEKAAKKPRLLLHVCCAPCSTTAIERLSQQFSVTAFFYNPNIHPTEERLQRIEEFERICRAEQIPCVCDHTGEEIWFELVKDWEQEPEGGQRCAVCYRIRLEKTTQEAKKGNFDCFATTLTLSPLKKADMINAIGQEIASTTGVRYLASNFKKQDGFRRSVELCRIFGLYRQDYCGCMYSQRGKEKL